MNTLMNKRGHSDLARAHVKLIAMSPIQGDTAGTERATCCIRLPISGMPTGSFC